MKQIAKGFALLCLFAWTGCGGGPAFQPVEGTVTFADGKPLEGGSVEFRPQDPAMARWTATGTIDKQGKFSLKTFVDNRYHDGAVAGKYSIIIAPPQDEGSMAGAAPPAVLHPDLLAHGKSGLSFEVKAGANACRLNARKP